MVAVRQHPGNTAVLVPLHGESTTCLPQPKSHKSTNTFEEKKAETREDEEEEEEVGGWVGGGGWMSWWVGGDSIKLGCSSLASLLFGWLG